MLWLCLHFTQLPLEVFSLAGPPDTDPPLAVTERHRVCAANDSAAALGIRPGMSASTAQALSGSLRLREREPAHETATLIALADWACNFSSQVCVSPPDRLLLEIGASLRLFHGEAALLGVMEADLAARRHKVCCGLGPTPSGAELMARALPCNAVALPPWQLQNEPDAFQKMLGKLPVELLAAPEKQQLTMQRMGFTRIGELLALPRAALGRRFGKAFPDYLQRLAGHSHDPRCTHRPRDRFESTLHFLEPVCNANMLLFPARRLLADMGRFLERRQLYCQRLEWRLGVAHGELRILPVACSLQQHRTDALLDLTRLALEGLRLAEATESLGLACLETAALEGKINSLFAEESSDGGEAERLLLDRLRLRLGMDRVHGLYLADATLPEQAWNGVHEPAAHAGTSTWMQRPCWLLRQPTRLGGTEAQPDWNGPIDLISGPERIDSNWWGEPQRRDYFIGRHGSGTLLWVFRERASGEWFAQGLFG